MAPMSSGYSGGSQWFRRFRMIPGCVPRVLRCDSKKCVERCRILASAAERGPRCADATPPRATYSIRVLNVLLIDEEYIQLVSKRLPYDAPMDTTTKRKRLGSRVRRLRYEHQINRKQFALMIGMDRGYLAGIESGKYNATFDKLCAIADGFDITLAELLAEVDDEQVDEDVTEPR